MALVVVILQHEMQGPIHPAGMMMAQFSRNISVSEYVMRIKTVFDTPSQRWQNIPISH